VGAPAGWRLGGLQVAPGAFLGAEVDRQRTHVVGELGARTRTGKGKHIERPAMPAMLPYSTPIRLLVLAPRNTFAGVLN
jgi:hypothetical protein